MDRFTRRARVVEVPFEPLVEDGPPTADQILPAPAATDDGTPLRPADAEAE